MKRIVGLIAGTAFAVAILAGCSATDNDRDGGNGDQPDNYGESSNVTLYLNVDRVPNVASFCLDNRRYSSTLASTDSGSPKSPVLVRVPEDDVELCGAKAR